MLVPPHFLLSLWLTHIYEANQQQCAWPAPPPLGP